jgi:hypothetical protein
MVLQNQKGNDMTTYTYDEQTVSDLHKAAYGFRPSEGFRSQWASATADQKQVIWDGLIATMEREMAFEAEMEARARIDLEARLAQMAVLLPKATRADCIRYLADSMNCMEESIVDYEYLDYKLGVKYGTCRDLQGVG